MSMKLEEFIKQTLLDITNGVLAAKKETTLWIAPSDVAGEPRHEPSLVSFEISVSVSGEGGGSIKVMGFGSGDLNVSRESIQKISFSVPVYFQGHNIAPGQLRDNSSRVSGG
jgi:hypothetical protein